MKKRFDLMDNGDNANSRVKQIASARFGVTVNYLNNCNEIEQRLCQEQNLVKVVSCHGFKVTDEIARLRHSTQG